MTVNDSIDHMVRLGLAALKEKGVFWYDMPRPTHFTVRDKLGEALGKDLLVLEPEPWDEFVFFEVEKGGNLQWLTPLALLRHELRYNRGVPEEELPVLPEGVNRLEDMLPGE